MSLEWPWNIPHTYSRDWAQEELYKDQSPLAVAARKSDVKFTVWDIRLKADAIREEVKNAPNIDPKDEIDAIYCIGPESLWRIMNGFSNGTSPNGKNIIVPMDDIYRFKEEVAKIFQENRRSSK